MGGARRRSTLARCVKREWRTDGRGAWRVRPRAQTVVPGNPVDDFKLLVRTVETLVRANALRAGKGVNVSFGSKANEDKLQVA